MQELLLIKHSGGEDLRIVEKAQEKWYDIGIELGLSHAQLGNMESMGRGDRNEQCRKMFVAWLEEGSKKYGTTWQGLVKVLQSVQLKPLAENIVYALNNED